MTLQLYDQLAPWYTLLTAPSEYAEEAAWYEARMREAATGELRSILELGCGAGANASYLRASFEVVGVDRSQPMLKECAALNPGMELHQGDMFDVRLGRRFDAVFVHDAISYVLDEAQARALVDTVAAHLEPGGVALLCPDDTWENFVPGSDDGGHDGEDGRGVRYYAWSHAGPGTRVHTDYAYFLREASGDVRVVHERHVTGRLHEATWVSVLREAGFEVRVVPLEHSEVVDERLDVFIGVRPG